jgi:hypothetical protein
MPESDLLQHVNIMNACLRTKAMKGAKPLHLLPSQESKNTGGDRQCAVCVFFTPGESERSPLGWIIRRHREASRGDKEHKEGAAEGHAAKGHRRSTAHEQQALWSHDLSMATLHAKGMRARSM